MKTIKHQRICRKRHAHGAGPRIGEENYFADTAIPDTVGLTEAQLAAALK